jgi:hypothetical protein
MTVPMRIFIHNNQQIKKKDSSDPVCIIPTVKSLAKQSKNQRSEMREESIYLRKKEGDK